LLADSVGLGKMIQAGLLLTELGDLPIGFSSPQQGPFSISGASK